MDTNKQISSYRPQLQTALTPEQAASSSLSRKWTHLELGAANYGRSRNGVGEGDLPLELRPLYNTIDMLISLYGTYGTLIINDLQIKNCEFVRDKAVTYLSTKHKEAQVEVKILAKDYTDIHIPTDCAVVQVDSIQLKNPNQFQLEEGLEGMWGTAEKVNHWIMRLVRSSKSGVVIFTPMDQKMDAVMQQFGLEKSEYDLKCCKSTRTYPEYLYMANSIGEDNPSWYQQGYVSQEKANQFGPDAYTFRRRNEQEFYTPQEMEVRNSAKNGLREKLKEMALDAGGEINNMMVTHPEMRLLQVFSRDSWKYTYVSIQPPEKFLLDEMHTLNANSFKPYFEKEKQDILKNYERDKSLINISLREVSSTNYADGSPDNFLQVLRFCHPEELEEKWRRLGLHGVYKLNYPNDEAFKDRKNKQCWGLSPRGKAPTLLASITLF